MPIGPAGIAGIYAGGSLISSIAGGLMSGSQSGLGFGEWLNRAQTSTTLGEQSAVRDFRNKMALAKQYGIHPLAMMGQNMSGHPIGNIGSGQSSSKHYDFSNVLRSLEKLPQSKLDLAKAEYFKGLAKKLDKDGQLGAGNVQAFDPGTGLDINIQNPTQIKGIRTGHGAAELGGQFMDKIAMDRNNFLHWTFPKDISESVESKTSLQVYDFIRETKKIIKRYGYWEAPWLPGGINHRKDLRKARELTLRAAKAAGYIPAGYTVRYDANNGAFKMVKDDGKNYLYTDTGLFGYKRYKAK